MNNQKMGSIVLRSLSILLGLFFIFVGLIKISSVLSKDLHKDLVSPYNGFSVYSFGIKWKVSVSACEVDWHSNVKNLRPYIARGLQRVNALIAQLRIWIDEGVCHFVRCLCLGRKEYVKYAKVFPFSEMLDFKIPSKWYRRTVGGLEMICGLAMAFIPNRETTAESNRKPPAIKCCTSSLLLTVLTRALSNTCLRLHVYQRA